MITDPAPATRRVAVEIVLDVACAWSYLGYSRFQRAAAQQRDAGITVEVSFAPFQVAPDAPSGGEPLQQVHRRHFGVAAADNEARMTELAAADGVVMNFDSAVFTNTAGAHRLIAAAAAHGRAEAMVGRRFRAYFTDGVNVGDRQALRTLAAELGVSSDEDDLERVQVELDRVRRGGVDTVPVFRFAGGPTLVGDQAEDVLRGALQDGARSESGR